MTKRLAILIVLLAAATTLLGATGCTKKKMMGEVDPPGHVTHLMA